MTANEHMIVRDYLMRNRWYYIGGFVIHLAAMTGCLWMEKPIMIGIFGGSAFILIMELNRGGNATTRTMLSMPVTADQLARCWRFVALGFPAMFFLAALLLAAVIGAVFHAPHLTLEFLLIIFIAQTLLLGMFYFALTGLPGQPRKGATLGMYVRDSFFGAIWGLSMPASMFLFQRIPGRFEDFGRGHIAAGILLAFGTIIGWFRADILVRERAARSGSGNRQHGKPSQIRSIGIWQRFGALTYLYARFASFSLLLMLAMLLFNGIFSGFLLSGSKSVLYFTAPQIGMFVVMSVAISIIQLLSQLRVLRTMPIRTSTLTHLLVFWPLAPAMMAGLLALAIGSLFNGALINGNFLQTSMFRAAFLQLMLPVVLRYGLRPWIFMPAIMLATIGTNSSLIFAWPHGSHWPWLLAGNGALLAFVWRSTYRLLGTPHPWRAGAMRWQALARRM